MEYTVQVRMNEKLFLRDPERSELGRRIIRQGIAIMVDMGFEEMTFRKLAERMGTTEASIYRYFENKHRLLVYLVAWYWQWLEYQVVFQTHNLTDPKEKLERILKVMLLKDLAPGDGATGDDIDIKALHHVVIREASKAYLTHHVTEDNRQQLFKPYKDLCGRIAGVILAYRPDYPYARSRASAIIETAHHQAFFMQHLPSLTDFGVHVGHPAQSEDALLPFLRHLLFSSLDCEVS